MKHGGVMWEAFSLRRSTSEQVCSLIIRSQESRVTSYTLPGFFQPRRPSYREGNYASSSAVRPSSVFFTSVTPTITRAWQIRSLNVFFLLQLGTILQIGRVSRQHRLIQQKAPTTTCEHSSTRCRHNGQQRNLSYLFEKKGEFGRLLDPHIVLGPLGCGRQCRVKYRIMANYLGSGCMSAFS